MDILKKVKWNDVSNWGVEGKAWVDTENFYDRLPKQASDVVPFEVWELSRHSTGMHTRFNTDSRSILARWTLRNETLALPHMPATSVSGIDLYGLSSGGHWQWVGVAKPDTFPQVQSILAHGLMPGMRNYMLYFPLFNGVTKLEIGVDVEATFIPIAPRENRPIIYYGTSVVHGIAASRAGMCHTAILGRLLDWPIVNLGFAGSGKMEPELAELLATLDPLIFIIDCLPNMEPDMVRERAENFLRILLERRPQTPIFLIEDRSYTNGWVIPALQNRNSASRVILREIFNRLYSSGYKQLQYIEGEQLLGDDNEACVDGSHPTDLGFLRIAKALAPVLKPFLNNQNPLSLIK